MGSTVTRQLEETDPQVAVIVAEPTLKPVTFPSIVTVATFWLLDVQDMVLSVVVSGITVADNCKIWPILIVPEVWLKVTDSAAVESTVTLQLATASPHFARMVQVPTFKAVTSPLATVAMEGSLLSQVMSL